MLKRWVLCLTAALMAVSLCCCGAAESLGALTDGVYAGTGAGKMGEIACEVTVEGGKITAVTVTEHSETPGLCDAALESVPAQIVEKQSLDVDLVSGATGTSKGILDAAKAALAQAGAPVQTVTALAAGRPSLGQPTEGEESYAGENILSGIAQHGEELVAKYGPKIKTLENGVQIQRTPSEYDSGGYSQPYGVMAYNNQFLGADNRGCGACHDDLAQTLRNMDGFVHVDLTNDQGLVLDVNGCIDCHSYSPGYVLEFYQLGTIVHNLHYQSESFSGDCFSCHNMTADGNGMTLWDNVKYDILRGIYGTDAETVNPSFSYDQDVLTDREDFFNYYWIYYDNDYTRFGAGYSGEDEGDPDVFNSWTISVNGLVENEMSWTLAELIEKAPSKTLVSTMQCTINPTGGPLIANVEITGIPMSWLLEQAGVKDGVAGYLPFGTDGFATGGSWEKYLENDAYLVYQINGEYLRISDGFPCLFWPIGGSAGLMTKQLSEITLVDAEGFDGWHIYQGWLTEEGWETGKEYYNKPNIGVYDMNNSGIILAPGTEYTLSGYAAAYDEKITGIEVSLDRGKTWTLYETPVDNYTLVQWHYALTMPESAGAYMVYVRAVESDGLKTPDVQKFLFNVK